MSLISVETMRAHRARWFVYADSKRIPYVKTMRGQWGYDVVCSCGWDSKTGGAIKRYVAEELWVHRFEAQSEGV